MTPSLHRFRIAAFSLALGALAATLHAQDTAWPTYGGNPDGQRYTTSSQIAPANLSRLIPAWTFHTGALQREPGRQLTFEDTPILYGDTLYVATPYNEVVALDPGTGEPRWRFDPHLKLDPANLPTSRGVAAWPLPGPPARLSGPCATRIFIATLDRRLIAIDAASGQLCTGFGDHGVVDLSRDVNFVPGDRYGVTSAPTVIGNVVVVGSLVPDNLRVDIESGKVRGYDVHDGHQVWAWEPLPWAQSQTLRTGAGNAWSTMAADLEHGIVYVPTGAASPDFYGGNRPGDDRDANSVVALDGATGKRLWGFQVVHHDVWDYDVAAEPLLFTWHGPDGTQNVPAVAINTKQGLLFLLNRLTGEPLFPIDEKPVPKSDIPGEQLSPTQPFQRVDTLAPISLDLNQKLGHTPAEDSYCHTLLSSLRYEGIYTPPSFGGSLAFPGNLGGVNWGSASLDPRTGILYANTNRYAFSLKLNRRDSRGEKTPLSIAGHARFVIGCAILLVILAVLALRRRNWIVGLICLALAAATLWSVRYRLIDRLSPKEPSIRSAEHFGRELGSQSGTPYTILRLPLVVPENGLPCMPQPWGTVSAINVNTGKSVWQTPLGTNVPGKLTGTVNLGGDALTATGLLFTGASEDPFLRAFDSATGKLLWQAALPAPAQATPMSYTWQGRQFVVIAAGGHSLFGTPLSDAVVAFALPASSPAR